MKRIIDVDENLICEGFVRNFTEEERNILIRAIGNSIPYEERPQGDFTRNELESWLYRIASNNLDNELGRSCEEIICRLNGFERFVSDMRKGSVE